MWGGGVEATKQEEGQVRFYPYNRGGAEKVLAMLKGDAKSFEVVLTRELEVLAILKGGAKSFHPLKKRGGGGMQKALPCLEGCEMFLTHNFSILLPRPLPVINDRSVKP